MHRAQTCLKNDFHRLRRASKCERWDTCEVWKSEERKYQQWKMKLLRKRRETGGTTGGQQQHFIRLLKSEHWNNETSDNEVKVQIKHESVKNLKCIKRRRNKVNTNVSVVFCFHVTSAGVDWNYRHETILLQTWRRTWSHTRSRSRSCTKSCARSCTRSRTMSEWPLSCSQHGHD